MEQGMEVSLKMLAEKDSRWMHVTSFRPTTRRGERREPARARAGVGSQAHAVRKTHSPMYRDRSLETGEGRLIGTESLLSGPRICRSPRLCGFYFVFLEGFA
jgi:hypothetical protein